MVAQRLYLPECSIPVFAKRMRVQILTGRVLLLLSDLPLPGCSLGLDALVPSRFGVRLNVGNFGEFLKK